MTFPNKSMIIRGAAVAAFAAAGIAGAATSAAAAPSVQPHTAGYAQCVTPQVSVSLTDASGAAGTTYYKLRLENVSKQTCVEYGFAGVSYRNSAGQQVGAAAARAAGGGQVVTLAPGHYWSATFSEVDALNYPASTCHISAVRGLRVYPPNQKNYLFIRQSTKGCTNTSIKQMTISAY